MEDHRHGDCSALSGPWGQTSRRQTVIAGKQ
jgi:hypothetical protein